MSYRVMGPVESPSRCLLIANGSPQKFQGALFAATLANAIERETGDPRATSLYLTHPDPTIRHAEIADRLKHLKTESGDRPVRIIVLGGDGSLYTAEMGLLNFLVPDTSDIFSALQSGFSPANAMLEGGIQVVGLPFGSANDTTRCFGTTAKTIPDALKLLKNLVPLRLNLGVATPNQGDPVLITHSFGVGSATRVFRWTEKWRSRFWSLYGRQFLALISTTFPQPLEAQWQKNGQAYRQKIVEVVGHTIPILGGSVGFPGTPREGLGYKILRNTGIGGVFRPTALRTFWEMHRLGKIQDDPKRLLPGTTLNNLPPHLQGSLDVGKSMTFTFYNPGTEKATHASFLCNGDFIVQTDGLTVASVPSGLLLGTPDSLMAQIQEHTTVGGMNLLPLAS